MRNTGFDLQVRRRFHSGLNSLPVRPFLAAAVGIVAATGAAQASPEFIMASGLDLNPLRTVLVTLHVVGLILGMGAAFFLDLMMIRHLYRDPVEQVTVGILEFGGRIVTAGFAILCLSGVAILALYWGITPGKLENPKIWAKVMVVSLLMLNGMLIHDILMPKVSRNVGMPLLAHRSFAGAFPFLAAGALSATGWAFTFTLGMVREFNFAFHGQVFLAAFLLALGVAISAACLIHLHLSSAAPSQRASTDTDETRLRWVLGRQRVARTVANSHPRNAR